MTTWFPAAFGLNAYGLTALLIVCGLAGETSLAAELGIAQSATLALFYAFSANVRNLVLRAPSASLVRSLLVYRLYLLLPLSLAAYYLSAGLGSAGVIVSAAVILRRCSEWVSELQLSAGEMAGDQGLAKRYAVSQAGFLAAVMASAALFPGAAPYAMLAWAVSPLPLSRRFLPATLRSPQTAAFPWREISPNFGSTAIIGVAAYIFRLILLLLAGKDAAGDLFTAFAIGGLVSSLYVSVFGPTMVLGEQRGLKHGFARWVSLAAWAQLLAGAALLAAYAANFSGVEIAGKSLFFAGAAGASLIGGSLMLQAQKIRLRLLQADGLNDLFGPDVLMNVAMIGSALFAFYAAGERALPFLYFWNSLLALLFYYSARAEARRERAGAAAEPAAAYGMKGLVYLLLIAPVFFQLGHGLFNDPLRRPYFDTLGVFMDLPLPVSIAGCFAGILAFGASGSMISMPVIFSVFSLMFISVVFSADGNLAGSMGKILLMIQFILPFFGLVLGQAASRDYRGSKLFQRTALLTVMAVAALQVVFTFWQHNDRLTPYLYVFSVYQHLQYVPTIFAAVYVLGIFSLFGERRYKPVLLAMAVLMPVYAVMSASMTALGLSVLGPLAYLTLSRGGSRAMRVGLIALALAAVPAASYHFFNSDALRYKFTFLDPDFSSMPLSRKLPNLEERLRYWGPYAKAITESGSVLAWGHAAPPPRTEFPSAHNYTLDFLYNFGAIPFIPFVLLLLYTLRGIWRRRADLASDGDLAGLAFVVLFLVLGDNSLKVGLRQPYPGILTFFAWGALLSMLKEKVPVPGRGGSASPGAGGKLRIAILNLTITGISGGYKSYLHNMLPRLAGAEATEALLCVSPESFRIKEWTQPHPKLVHQVCLPYGALRRRLDPGAEKALLAFRPDVVFVPVARWVDCGGAPVVSMVQNMAPLVSWSWYGLGEYPRLLMQLLETRRAAVKSEKVIVMSDFVRQFIMAGWGLPRRKLPLVYFGAPGVSDAPRRPACAPEGDFILTAGSLEPYRALEDVLGAAAILRREGRPRRFLVAGGARPEMRGYAEKLRALSIRQGTGNDVIWAGQLSYGELSWCYSNCKSFVMSSRVETLGMIALEALAHGAVCVSSLSSPLPEVFSGAASYYAPGDAPGLAGRLLEAEALSPSERAGRVEAARARAAAFNWDEAANRTINVLRGAAGRTGT